MDIAFIVPYMKAGGVETFVLTLGQFLQKQGHKVSVISTITEGEWWDRVDQYGLHKVSIDIQKSIFPINHIIRIGKYLSGSSHQIMFFNYSRYAQMVLNMLPDEKIVIPIIQNNYKDTYKVGCANSESWNAAVAVSPKIAKVFKEIVPHKTVLEIYHCVDAASDELWKRRVKLQGEIKLLFAGRISQMHKGVFYLPEILAGCLKKGLEASLTIIGEGNDLETLQKIIADKSIQSKVIFKDIMSLANLYEEMISHHILLMPSNFEGCPLISLNAQACGCVPIATRLKDITDRIILEGQTGYLVEKGDVEKFVYFVEKLYNNTNLWENLSNNGYRRVKESFSVERMGNQYLDLIKDAMLGSYPLAGKRNKKKPIYLPLLSWRDFIPNVIRKLRG